MTMQETVFTRRQFFRQSAVLAAGALVCQRALPATVPGKRSAVDQVPLGQTGLKISRLGIGIGSNSGRVQRELGREDFDRLVRHAYDRGITYIDTAQGYQTFEWVAGAIKGLPREKLFIQSKIPGKPENVLQAVDRHRQVFQTDYIDSLLIHCMVKDGWTEEFKRVMDGLDEAKAKHWIRAKGVSCHSLPALRAATASSWTEIHLVRVNPQAKHIDGPEEHWDKPGTDLDPVLAQVKTMHAKGRGVIGMKIIGNGDFTRPEDREKSIRFAMSHPEINAVVIGFKSAAEVDEAIDRIDRALAQG